MKVFDIGELKKTARVKQMEVNRSYSEIHKSPLRSSTQENLSAFESCYLSRWGRNLESRVDSVSPWVNVGQGIFSVAVGEQHALILNSTTHNNVDKNELFGYGNNTYGQLAQESESISRPTPISSFKDMKITSVHCGGYHSFVQNSKG